MKKGKNFFYRINPNEVLGEVIFAENKEKWFLQFFDDLRKDDPEACQTDIAADIIREAHGFREKRSKAGKASAEQRGNKEQHKATNVEHMLNKCATEGQPVAVAVTVTEPLKSKSKDLSEYSDDFNSFWSAYPDKTGKGKANESWLKLKPPLETVLQALQWQRETQKWREGFVPNPATYLNQRRWEDSPPERERSGPITFEKQKSIDRKQAMIDFVMEGEADGKHQRNENQICLLDG